MSFPRFRIRTLMIAVAAAGLGFAFSQATIKSDATPDRAMAGLVLAIPFAAVTTVVLDALSRRT